MLGVHGMHGNSSGSTSGRQQGSTSSIVSPETAGRTLTRTQDFMVVPSEVCESVCMCVYVGACICMHLCKMCV